MLGIQGFEQRGGLLGKPCHHVLEVRVRHQGKAQLVLRAEELLEMAAAKSALIGGNARIRLHHRAAQRNV